MFGFVSVPIRWLSRMALLAAGWDLAVGNGWVGIAATLLLAQALWSLHLRVARR